MTIVRWIGGAMVVSPVVVLAVIVLGTVWKEDGWKGILIPVTLVAGFVTWMLLGFFFLSR